MTTTAWGGLEWSLAALIAVVFVASLLIWRGLEREPRRTDWAWPVALTTFVAAAVLLAVRNLVFVRTLLNVPPDVDLGL